MTGRFTVGSVTGWKIAERGRYGIVWYVHDSAYAYRIVSEHRGVTGEAKARRHADKLNTGKTVAKTCRRGHDRTEWNTYTNPRTGQIHCRVCAYDREKENRERKRANRIPS